MAEPTRIGVIAASGAGVTSWLGAMAASARHDRPDALHLHGLDGESVAYLQRVAESLRSREPPPPGPLLTGVRLHAHSDDFDADFHLLDPDGRQVEQALKTLDDGRLEPLFDHLARCPVLWLFLDPDRDLEGEFDGRERRLTGLMTLLAERRKRAVREGGEPLPDVAVILTKMDAHPNVRSAEQARRFALKRQPAFLAKLGRHAHRIAVFSTSAFGRGSDGPSGIQRVLQWTAESVRRRQVTPRRRKIAAALAGLAFLAASFGAWRYADRLREESVVADEAKSKTERIVQTTGASERAEEVRQRLFRERLDELAAELAGDVGEGRLQETTQELARLRRSQPGRAAARLEEVQRLIDRRREDRLLAEIRDAAEHQRPNLDALVEQFQREFPNSDRRSQIEEWRKGFLDRELQAARTAVRLIVATDAASLERKAAAIGDFFQRFGGRLESAERAQIKRAAELGLKFAKPTVYRVRLKRSGNLTSSRVQHVKVIVEGNPVKEFLAPRPTTTATWDKTCDVTWQAGGGARAILVSQSKNWVNFNYYVIAERAEEDLFALRALSSLGPPHVREAWANIFNNGEAYLDLEVEGLTADDWRIAGEYLFPGEKW